MDDRLEVVVDHPHDQYTGEDIHQLRFICLCRAMDMSLEEVRTLLNLALRRKADYRAANLALNEHIGHVRTHLHRPHDAFIDDAIEIIFLIAIAMSIH